MSVPILILAGGASRRMGARDKLLEPVHGQPLLRLQAWRALKVSPAVSVLIRPDRPDLESALEGLNVRIIRADESEEGIGGSIRAGTRAHLDQSCFLLMLADLVDIDSSDLRAVIGARNLSPGPMIWRGATTDGKPGHPILFEQPVFEDLLQLQGDTGGETIMAKHAGNINLVALPGAKARRDLDTPQDWDNWRAEQNA